MSRPFAIARRVGRTLMIAVLILPAGWPIEDLLTAAGELTGAFVPSWTLLVVLLGVGFVLAGTYDGPAELLLPTALLTVGLTAGLQWLVGLWGLNVISMQLLAAEALTYLAALSSAIAIVFETRIRDRLASVLGAPDTQSNPDPN